ncbi:MAG: dipeptide ABC transporter ATP-binding protein [Burkholderiaceae bacterium]
MSDTCNDPAVPIPVRFDPSGAAHLHRDDPDILVAEDLHVALESDAGIVKALDGVHLSVARGETFALVGESGCGKSMTAMALMRLLPDNGRIDDGSVRLDREELLVLPESRMREHRGGKIGIIFQDPSTSLNPVLKVGDQIVETIVAHTGLRGAAARAKAIDWLKLVGIPEPERRIDNYPFQMSGGQKQRVMIAIALAAEPEMLIADEPTTALDVTIQAQILDLLKDLQQRLGMAMMLITHDLAVVAQMAHRVALMYAGQIVEVADASDFFARPLHPYAVKLFDALPESGKRDVPLAAIPGTVPPLTLDFRCCRFADRCDAAVDHCRSHVPPMFGDESRAVAADAGPVATHPVRCFIYDPTLPAAQRPVLPPERVVGVSQPRVASDARPLLVVKDLTVHFPIRKGVLRRIVGHVRAVDGVSFSIAPGRTLALVGESGCGKTTTGKALLQLLRSQAEVGGETILDGERLDLLEGRALQRVRPGIQIIFQDPFASLDPRMRVSDILEEGLITLRPDLNPEQRLARLATLLEQVGIRNEAMDRYPHEFSGGQRQRLAIARALAVEPGLVVCDEPTSALDVSVQAQILNLLKQLQRDLGIAYLFITHNIGVVEYLADDVAVMVKGKIVEQGPAEQVLRHPAHEYTRSLLAAVPRLRPA